MSKPKVHFIIFGVGAIGGFYGAQVAHYLENNQVDHARLSFVARGKTYEALKHNGINLICRKDNFGEMQESLWSAKNLNVYQTYADVPIRDDELTVVMLCVKSKDTVACAQDIAPKVTDHTAVISVQNGVENEEKIGNILGTINVIACLTNVAAETLEPGAYIQKGVYGLMIGELDENKKIIFEGKARIETIYDLLASSGIAVKTNEDMMKALWSKLVWNASFNPISVLYKANIGEILDNPEAKERVLGVMAEVKLVAAAEGMQLDPEVDKKHIERTSALDWRDFKTSMLQDYLKNKEIELEDLLGVIIRKGEKHSIETPFAKALYDDLNSTLSAA